MAKFNENKQKVQKIVNKINKFSADLLAKNLKELKLKLKDNSFMGPHPVFDSGWSVHSLDYPSNFENIGVLNQGDLLAVRLDADGIIVDFYDLDIPLEGFPTILLGCLDTSIRSNPLQFGGYLSTTDRSTLTIYKGNYTEVYGDGQVIYKGEAPILQKTLLSFDDIVTGGMAPNLDKAKQLWKLKVTWNNGVDTFYNDGVLYGVRHDFDFRTSPECGGPNNDFTRFEGFYTFQPDVLSSLYAANLDPINLTTSSIEAKGLVYDFLHVGTEMVCSEEIEYHTGFETHTFNLSDLTHLYVQGSIFKLVSGNWVSQGNNISDITGSQITNVENVSLLGYHLMYDNDHLWFFGISQNTGINEGNDRYHKLNLQNLPNTVYVFPTELLNLTLPYAVINFKRNPGEYPTKEDITQIAQFNKGGISKLFVQSQAPNNNRPPSYVLNIFADLYAYMPATKQLPILIPEYNKNYVPVGTTYETDDEFTTKERVLWIPENSDIYLRTKVMFNNAGFIYDNKKFNKTENP